MDDILYEKIQENLSSKIRFRDRLTPVEFVMCSRELRQQYIDSCDYYEDAKILKELEYSVLDVELQKVFLQKLIDRNKSLNPKLFLISNDEIKQFYITKVIPKHHI